jgi:hypothetical protein
MSLEMKYKYRRWKAEVAAGSYLLGQGSILKYHSSNRSLFSFASICAELISQSHPAIFFVRRSTRFFYFLYIQFSYKYRDEGKFFVCMETKMGGCWSLKQQDMMVLALHTHPQTST